MTGDPIVELDAGFSAEDGRATSWATALELLEKAEVFWLSTVRADGRPHVTPLVAVWLDGALYFCTGEGEQKERNIQRNPHCILTTGCNNFREGLDLVIEGDAVQVGDESRLHRLAGLCGGGKAARRTAAGVVRRLRGPTTPRRRGGTMAPWHEENARWSLPRTGSS